MAFRAGAIFAMFGLVAALVSGPRPAGRIPIRDV